MMSVLTASNLKLESPSLHISPRHVGKQNSGGNDAKFEGLRALREAADVGKNDLFSAKVEHEALIDLRAMPQVKL